MAAASPEPLAGTLVSASSVSPVPYAVNGGYETLRYLVPVQQQQQQQQSYVLMQQPMMQQLVSPVYLQGLQGLQTLSVGSHDSELLFQQDGAVGGPSLL